MKNHFITDNFLLQSKFAEELYHDYAAKQPIIDYHCHLPPDQIAADHVFENLTQVWINGDHYKWRAMRTVGINEKYITGNAGDAEKFQAWAETVPQTLRNPLYHWTHLELKRYFDIDLLLNKKTAQEIYQEASTRLNSAAYSCQKLIQNMNVEVVCTTEDPTDTLEHHRKLAKSGYGVHISTSFRPDKALLISHDGYKSYLRKLEKASGLEINSFKTLCDALAKRVDYFHENGCRLSDHGLSYVPYTEASDTEIESIFTKKEKEEQLTPVEIEKYQTALLLFLGEQYHAKGWVQQFHLGALRNNNSRMLHKLGPDTGWDSMGDYPQAYTLSRFLDALDSKDKLAKTILYNLNPSDNEVLAAMIGNFNDGTIKGKMQFGSGWWFLDQKDGITKQLNALSNMGLLSCFIGMLTDSRSFLSYPRHEYFRRILCNLLGEEIEKGELPNDVELIGNMVMDICYGNAKKYFDFQHNSLDN
ncbi:glucuronate isomerase [Flagellimonas sediminis]|uniref:Uronate isomerase n=1 Tax=Flagellimonas sediminis TaxID=2696468 RepID=A0A6I5L3Z1_9FLAO|nr:glucuronate isomerase [Allomuricauda sediminis]NDV44778.1 glucuronate isomerase [Allomuricauda sediminis]